MKPPKLLNRNEYGLLDNLEYFFKEDNTIDYRKMIPTEFLYVNPAISKRKKIEMKYGKSYKEIDVINDKVSDEDLTILLKGTQFLARLRGYNKIDYIIRQANESFVGITCSITFIGNYETQGREVVFSENASATLDSTKGFGQKYLIECCTNRSFCRVVNNFLNTNLLSNDEFIGGTEEEYSEPQESQSSPQIFELLTKALKDTGKTFETLKDRLIKEDFPGAKEIKTLEQIPPEKAFYFLDMLKNLKSKA